MLSSKLLLLLPVAFFAPRTARAQCGDKCGLYGGFASVATLNFGLDDCKLVGSWLLLDCPGTPKGGSLWHMTSFSDEDGKCSYEKPVNVQRETFACEDHKSWDVDWTDSRTCSGQYLWRRDNYVAFPSGGCNPYMTACGFDIHHEVLSVRGSFQDTKVLCNSGDFLSLLGKGSNGRYTLVFKTTYNDYGFSRVIPRKEGKYCTAMWELVKYLRTDLQADGSYEKLP